MKSRLRMLEMSLLEELGYGLVLDADAESGEQIIAQHYYRYVPQLGLQRLTTNHRGDALLGQHLLSLVAGDWQQQEVLQVARVVLRTAIDFYLDGRHASQSSAIPSIPCGGSRSLHRLVGGYGSIDRDRYR